MDKLTLILALVLMPFMRVFAAGGNHGPAGLGRVGTGILDQMK